METLWLWMAPLCALLYTLCMPLAPNDLWYHVRAGELISSGAIPTQNQMSSGIPLDTPYYYQSWLAEFVLFQTLKWSGLSGLALLRAGCVCGAFFLVTAATFRFLLRLPHSPPRLVAARITAFGGVIGLAMASNNVDLRPQVFSLLFFGAWTFAALEFRASISRNRARWGAFLVILTLIWANTHGAFIISLLGLATLSLCDLFTRHERFKTSLLLLMASCVAVLLNPRGAALYRYVAGLSRDEVSQKFVQEWKSPGFDEWHSILFWICAVSVFTVGIFIAVFLERKARPGEELGRHDEKSTFLLLSGLFFALAARDQRSIVWFALWFVPVFGVVASYFIREKRLSSPTSNAVAPRAALVLNSILLIFLVLAPLTLFPRLKADWPWPAEFRRRFAPTPALFNTDPPLLLENTTPVAAAQFLLKNPPRKRLFTDMVCGSYLTYAGRGQIKPFCDPRIELFPVAFWEDYLRLSAGPANATAQLQARGFTDALLDKENTPALVARFQLDPRWQVVARNGSTLLFRLKKTKKS